MLNCLKYYTLILQIHQKIKKIWYCKFACSRFKYVHRSFYKIKGKYSVLDKRTNLIKEEILNKILILNKIHMWNLSNDAIKLFRPLIKIWLKTIKIT